MLSLFKNTCFLHVCSIKELLAPVHTDSPASLCFYIFVTFVLLPDYSLEQLYERGFLSLCDLYWIFGYMSVGSNIFE